MNAYTIEKTALAVALDNFYAQNLTVANELSHLVGRLNAGHAYLWGLPDAVLTDFLNTLGPERVTMLMEDHFTMGTMANAILDRIASPDYPERAIVTPGREISLSAAGVFSVVPLPEPEPLPEPDPDPEPLPDPLPEAPPA
jgi:hypothetical protein